MLYVCFAEDLPGCAEKRAASRDAHVAYLHGTPDVVVLAGATFDASDARLGSCIVIAAPDFATAENWFANEPWNKAGLFASAKVVRVAKGTFHPELAANEK